METGARFVLDPRRKHFPTLLSDGRLRRVDLLCTAVDVAVELGAPVVSMWSGAAPTDEPRELAWDLLVDGCERVLEHAERQRDRAGLRARARDAGRDAGRLRAAAASGSGTRRRSA